jgi:hypothetical protein
MLAFRPLQSKEGNWLDEDDPIDRALNSIELIENALQVPHEASNWIDVLLGEWSWPMQHPTS